MKNILSLLFCIILAAFCNAQKIKPQNTQHPEITGKWRPDKFLGANPADIGFQLKPTINNDKPDNKYGNFVEINKDFTFHSYTQGSCGMGCGLDIKGTYSFDKKGKIIFLFQEFIYSGEGCKGQKKQKPFTPRSFTFKKENGILTLKMNMQ